MHVTVAELNRNISGKIRDTTSSGEPLAVVNGGKRGSPTEAVVVSAELWDEILRVPSVRKRIKEHAAAKQASQEDSLSDVA